jgi:hypothetical protein
VVISTSTSSGKSLAYNVPVIEALLGRHTANNSTTTTTTTSTCAGTALLLFPTKALAVDQLRVLKEMVGYGWFGDSIRPRTFDGDTPEKEREDIRLNANVILANPDILHVTVLPNHVRWSRFIANLRSESACVCVCVSLFLPELTPFSLLLAALLLWMSLTCTPERLARTCHGTRARGSIVSPSDSSPNSFCSCFGSVFRRLLRLCVANNNRTVRFFCCSATLHNPLQHFLNLVPVAALSATQDAQPAAASSETDLDFLDEEDVKACAPSDVKLVATDTSPTGSRHFVIWNPPLIGSSPANPVVASDEVCVWVGRGEVGC